MNKEELQKSLMEFERNRAQLVTVSTQKQQMQMLNSTIKKALEELEKTEEKKIYQVVGNIMIAKDVKTTKKELREQKETNEMRVKALQKQEDALIDKLNKLKAAIEIMVPKKPVPGEVAKAEKPEERKTEKKK